MRPIYDLATTSSRPRPGRGWWQPLGRLSFRGGHNRRHPRCAGSRSLRGSARARRPTRSTSSWQTLPWEKMAKSAFRVAPAFGPGVGLGRPPMRRPKGGISPGPRPCGEPFDIHYRPASAPAVAVRQDFYRPGNPERLSRFACRGN